MAEERDDLEFTDPLEGLDLGLLSFDENGKKVENDSTNSNSSTFEVRDGDNSNEKQEPENKEDTTENNEPVVENKNVIGVRDVEDNTTDTDDNSEDGSEGVSDTHSMWSAFANNGIIDLDEGELEDEDIDKDLEWFASKAQDKLDKGIEEAVENYKDTLPQEVRYLLDNYESGVSILDLVKADKAIMDYETIKEDQLEDNESLQKGLVADMYRLQGESEDDIKGLVEDLEAAGLLDKQSKRALGKLKTYKKTQREEMIRQQKEADLEARQKYEDKIKSLKKTIDSKEEIIPGIQLNDKQKKQLFNGITKFDREGKNEVMRFRESNPDFDLVVAYLATALNKGGKINWDQIVTVAETKATKNLKDKANKTGSGGSTKRSNNLKGVDVSIMKNAIGF